LFDRRKKAWVRSGELRLPAELPFVDYAGIGLKGNRVGVVSQESSMVWVNSFKPGGFEWDGDGDVLHFPKSKDGKRQYFTVEGFAWLDNNHFVAVSDKRKTTEPVRAKQKDQSIHIFRMH
jgi:hypothetical protein